MADGFLQCLYDGIGERVGWKKCWLPARKNYLCILYLIIIHDLFVHIYRWQSQKVNNFA